METQVKETSNLIQLPDDYRFRLYDKFRDLDVNTYLADKLDKRVKYSVLCNPSNPKYKENRAIAYNLAKDDFKFFADNFVWIQNPRADERKGEKKEIPFNLYPFQGHAADEIIKAIENGTDIPIEKSRDMGLSWLVMSIFVWGWHFHGWDSLVGGQKFENVDMVGNVKSLIGKARYVIKRMPVWMRPKLTKKVHDKNGLLVHPGHGATLAGESNNPNFGRSDRRKAILFDEYSSWTLTDKSAWQSCSSTTLCRIPLSTPNDRGTNCYFYQVVNNAKKKDLPLLTLHWCLHPVFNKEMYVNDLGEVRSPWYDNELNRATDIAQAHQELDINYEASMSGKVFPGFSYEQNVREDVEYDPNLPLYISWDFGLDQTAILWLQPDPLNGTLNVIDEYQNDGTSREGSDIMHYIHIVNSKPYKKAVHFGDPQSGENRSLAARGMSNAGILRREGFIFKCKRTKVQNRIAAARNLIPKLRVSSQNCPLFIEACTSWQMIKARTGSASQVPAHDEYSHIGEAFSYYAFNKRQQEIRSFSGDRQSTNYEPNISGVML
jgi:hypothetical protein